MTETQTVAALQREWIFGWDKTEGAPARDFRAVFERYYDFDAEVIFFDEADARLRTFRSVQAYAEAFWPGFQALRSARHSIEEEPEVLVSGDLAAGRMVFLAVLTTEAGETSHLRCHNSQVWQRTAERDWHIVRDQTTVHTQPSSSHAL